MADSMELYLKLERERQSRGERGKCVVIMLAILTGKGYAECLERLNASTSRKVGKAGGYYHREWYPVLQAMLREQGKQPERVPIDIVRKYAKTIRTFSPRNAARLRVADGYILSHSHVSAVKGGHVLDWADGRRKIIREVVRVVPLEA